MCYQVNSTWKAHFFAFVSCPRANYNTIIYPFLSSYLPYLSLLFLPILKPSLSQHPFLSPAPKTLVLPICLFSEPKWHNHHTSNSEPDFVHLYPESTAFSWAILYPAIHSSMHTLCIWLVTPLGNITCIYLLPLIVSEWLNKKVRTIEL